MTCRYDIRTYALAAALAAVALVFCLVTPALAEPATPSPGLPPHVATETETPVCAMCHRSHTSASTTVWEAADHDKRSALIIGTTGTGDTGLCYTCHGIDSLGSGTDVQSSSEASTGHVLMPESPKWGSSKQCSTCHDSHGSARVSPGVPYPSLLRIMDADGNAEYQGVAVCESCHSQHSSDGYDGQSVFEKTAHADIPQPSSGTKIVCSSCHEPHGSAVDASLRSELQTPAVSVPTSVPEGGRQWCFGCHASSVRTWPGASGYTGSSHATSTARVDVSGDWATVGTTRQIGDCDACHAPMGRNDGSGKPIPRMLEKRGRALCDDCHRAGGSADTDLASLASTIETSVSELLAEFTASSGLSRYARLQAYTRESPTSTQLIGPREYQQGVAGRMVAGDIDSDQVDEVVLARSGSSTVTVMSHRAGSGGLASDPGDRTLLGPADFIAIGNVIDGIGPVNELLAVDVAAGVVRVYRFNGVTFVPLTALSLPSEPTGIAVGDLNGVGTDEVAITLKDPDALALVSTSGAALSLDSTHAADAGVRSPAIGEVWDSGSAHEVVVANAGEVTGAFSVFSAAGARLADLGSAADASATAVILADVVPDEAGSEIVGALGAPTGAARIAVFAQRPGPSFASPLGYPLATGDNPSALAAGNLDNDGDTELAVANAGHFAVDATRKSASITVFDPLADGSGIEATATLRAGGTEVAGGEPSIAIANVGSLGLSRHPVDAGPGSHSTTETAGFERHVVCVDCHNTHEATAATRTAPAVVGELLGARGVVVSNDSGTQVTLESTSSAVYEYGVCLRCHSSWSQLNGTPSIASEFNTQTASFHPVEAKSPETNAEGNTLVTPYAKGSRVRCTDCHGNTRAASEVDGPHRSTSSPLLVRPLAGTDPAGDNESLCFKCHRNDIYATGSMDGSEEATSGFFDGLGVGLHARHVQDGSFSCASCHDSHGSRELPFLLRDDIGWTTSAGDGGCANDCHSGGVRHSYTR